MTFNRFDIVEAHYCWLQDNHEGMWSQRYAKLCKLCKVFKPSIDLSYWKLTENGRAIYDNMYNGEPIDGGLS